MKGISLLLVGLAACGTSHSTEIVCGSHTQGLLTAGTVTVKSSDDLNGAAVAAEAHTTVPTGVVTISCAPTAIVPDGYVALGPPVSFGGEGTWSDRPFELTLPYKAARLPKGAAERHVRIVAKPANGAPYFPAVSDFAFDDKDPYASHVTFHASELTTYEVVAAKDAGTAEKQPFAYRALIGVSMGGNAAMSIALRHPDDFDVLADLGGEPGPSIVYSVSMIKQFLFGGFCTAAEQAAGQGTIGQLCPNHTTKADQYEIESDYEHMVTQEGDGVGLTLNRSLYMKASRDLSRALGNPALYNPANAYAPPGVDAAFLQEDAATRCANPTVLHDFYSADFNPDGSKPVITFCDGGDVPGMNAVFDPTQPQTDPAEVLLAVDLNNNGKRDAGEPVIINAYEPFSDVGTDGKADKDEPGYDPVTNPDPDGDDYHWLRNPNGTEGNGNYDQGEPFQDVGVDGVAGTCQAGQTPPAGVSGCYDYGEGNGTWDMTPNLANWYANDLEYELAALTDAQRRHVAMWFDAGIRDFLNASVSANQAVGQAIARWNLPFGVYNGFAPLVPGSTEGTYDFTEIPWDAVPHDVYLRYGNPDASAANIMNGDGRHVGTANQIIYRIESALAFIDKRLPGGDRSDELDGGQTLMNQSFTAPSTGRVTPYALFLPPGYNKPENATKRYPVVYVLHGYGQSPNDLVALSAIIANHMIATEPMETRIQKFIMVYADGQCSPKHDGVPVPPGGDGCEEGTFFMNAPLGGPAQMESNLMDLVHYIDQNYRTMQPGMAEVTP